jgi:Branched-chain amino acid transport protein (AzlD)
MSALDDGFGGYLALALVGFLVHEPWRWLGLALGRNVTVDSGLFLWVRAVATALVAGLVMRLILFPAGALAGVPLSIRIAAIAIGATAYWLTGRNLGAGVAAGAASIYLGIAYL